MNKPKRPTREKVLADARRAIEQDDVIVYDACANAGQMVGNVPRRVLEHIVLEFMLEESR